MRTILCLLAATLLFVPACGRRQTVKPHPETPSRDLNGEWTLHTLNSQVLAANKAPWIKIEVGGSLRGWAGVNQISSQLDQAAMDRGEFKPSPIVATRMAGPPESMKIESDFLAALQSARTYTAGRQTLHLNNESGGMVAGFVRKSAR